MTDSLCSFKYEVGRNRCIRAAGSAPSPDLQGLERCRRVHPEVVQNT
jgi:hypothetical protein